MSDGLLEDENSASNAFQSAWASSRNENKTSLYLFYPQFLNFLMDQD